MANIVKLNVDSAVYDYSRIMWMELVGLSPEKVVYRLSTGEGVTSEMDNFLVGTINDFLHRIDRFVPRVRLDIAGGNIYGVQCNTLTSRWRRKLTAVRSSLIRSSKVTYLSDAVNAIITKPCKEEIERLEKSISTELELQKSGQVLDDEQQQKVNQVTKLIAEQQQKLRKLPRCNNTILTVMLHEVMDRMSQQDIDKLARLKEEEAKIQMEYENQYKELKEIRSNLGSRNYKYLGAGVQEEYEKKLPLLEEEIINKEGNLSFNGQEVMKILEKYYDHIRPEVVAEGLLSAPNTFWQYFNIRQTWKSVSVRLSSKQGKAASADKKSGQARKRKQPTAEQQAEELMLFPYRVSSVDTEELQHQLFMDNQIMDEYDQWTQQFSGQSLTPEYQAKYYEFCNRFLTIPESAKAALSQEPAFVQQQREREATVLPVKRNYDRLKAFLVSIGDRSEEDDKVISDSDAAIRTVSEFKDFEDQFKYIEQCGKKEGLSNPLRYVLSIIRKKAAEQANG